MFGDFGSNVPAATTALMQQKGAKPFTYSLANKEDISINLDDQATKHALLRKMAVRKLAGTVDQSSPPTTSPGS